MHYKSGFVNVALVAGGVLVLQGIRLVLIALSVPGVHNHDPLGLEQFWQVAPVLSDTLISVILMIGYFFIVFAFDLHKYFLWGILCISIGIVSNIGEKILYGAVFDYIPIGVAVLNGADVSIIAGLIFLHKQIWTSHSKKQDYHDIQRGLASQLTSEK
jgi:hypothetical protein